MVFYLLDDRKLGNQPYIYEQRNIINDAISCIQYKRGFSGRGTIQTEPEYILRTKIDVIVKDDQVEQLVLELTDKLGSELGGKIFVSDIPVAVDLRTKKTGVDAI